jgi:hypothetical protein
VKLRNTLCTLALWVILGYHAAQIMRPNIIPKLPDLYWIANNAISFAGFVLMSVYAHVKMYEI